MGKWTESRARLYRLISLFGVSAFSGINLGPHRYGAALVMVLGLTIFGHFATLEGRLSALNDTGSK